MAEVSVPALIVSGYLGSGKTTLVSRLLKDAVARGVKLAIVSNEFGDTGIDRALLDAGQDGFVELDGGCVCCRLSDALSETLESILTTVKPDRLVLETSGVALPGEVVVQFWRPPLRQLISDEVVVVVVDAERANGDLDETFLEQIEAADLLLLNKCDLVDASGLDAAEARLDDLSGGQPVMRTVQCDVDPTLLYPPDPEGLRLARRDPDAPSHPHVHESFNTTEIEFPGVVEESAVLAEVASHHAIRAKGFVRTPAGIRVVQGVGPRIQLTVPEVEVAEALVGRVVVIHRVEGHVHEHA
ncbi:MAG: GTP-binding protein [Alphaproteobacteria bacterium]|nr:GTP-binding protein [Alphaproteobacteria bacterium]